MPKEIKICVGEITLIANLYSNEMAANVWSNLPIEGNVNKWGREIYFSTRIEKGDGETRSWAEVGELGFWDKSNAICIFYGPTPATLINIITLKGLKPRAASPIVAFGKINNNAKVLKKTSSGEKITVKKL